MHKEWLEQICKMFIIISEYSIALLTFLFSPYRLFPSLFSIFLLQNLRIKSSWAYALSLSALTFRQQIQGKRISKCYVSKRLPVGIITLNARRTSYMGFCVLHLFSALFCWCCWKRHGSNDDEYDVIIIIRCKIWIDKIFLMTVQVKVVFFRKIFPVNDTAFRFWSHSVDSHLLHFKGMFFLMIFLN